MQKRVAKATTAGALAIVVLALGLRLYAAWDVNRSQPDTRARLYADEPGYDNLARGLLNGEGLTWPGRVPLYPVWLAALHRITGYSYARAIYVQACVGAIAVWLTFVLGRDRFGRTAGLLAALGVALHIGLIRESTRFLSEILFTPAVLAIAIGLERLLQEPTKGRAIWVGVWIGVANLIRPTLVAFPFWAALMMVRRSRDRHREGMSHAAMLVCASLLVVAPWIARNYVKYGALYPLATSNAILWQGSPEYVHLVRQQGYTYLDVWNKVIYGPGGEGHDPGSVEGDRYWTRRALRSIAAEPLVYVRFCAEKAVTYWIGDPAADWNDTFVFNYRALREIGHSRSAAVQLIVWRAVPVIAFMCLLAAREVRRRVPGIISVLAYCTVLHSLTHAEVRLSEPLHPLLLVVTSGALASIWQRRAIRDKPLR
jgi:hypothetical protein